MQLNLAQERVAKQQGLQLEEVQFLWVLRVESPELWKALEKQARRIIESELGVLRSSEDLTKILRAQGRVNGVERLLLNVEQLIRSVEDLKNE